MTDKSDAKSLRLIMALACAMTAGACRGREPELEKRVAELDKKVIDQQRDAADLQRAFQIYDSSLDSFQNRRYAEAQGLIDELQKRFPATPMAVSASRLSSRIKGAMSVNTAQSRQSLIASATREHFESRRSGRITRKLDLDGAAAGVSARPTLAAAGVEPWPEPAAFKIAAAPAPRSGNLIQASWAGEEHAFELRFSTPVLAVSFNAESDPAGGRAAWTAAAFDEAGTKQAECGRPEGAQESEFPDRCALEGARIARVRVTRVGRSAAAGLLLGEIALTDRLPDAQTVTVEDLVAVPEEFDGRSVAFEAILASNIEIGPSNKHFVVRGKDPRYSLDCFFSESSLSAAERRALLAKHPGDAVSLKAVVVRRAYGRDTLVRPLSANSNSYGSEVYAQGYEFDVYESTTN